MMTMMLGNKYLMDRMYARAKKEYVRSFEEDKNREDALLLALVCSIFLEDHFGSHMLISRLIENRGRHIETGLPVRLDETFFHTLESIIGDDIGKFTLSVGAGKIKFKATPDVG